MELADEEIALLSAEEEAEVRETEEVMVETETTLVAVDETVERAEETEAEAVTSVVSVNCSE